MLFCSKIKNLAKKLNKTRSWLLLMKQWIGSVHKHALKCQQCTITYHLLFSYFDRNIRNIIISLRSLWAGPLILSVGSLYKHIIISGGVISRFPLHGEVWAQHSARLAFKRIQSRPFQEHTVDDARTVSDPVVIIRRIHAVVLRWPKLISNRDIYWMWLTCICGMYHIETHLHSIHTFIEYILQQEAA